MNKIEIAEKEYRIKFGYRAYMLFEELADKPFSQFKGLRDMLLLYYCAIKGNDETFTMTFEEFVDFIESDIQNKAVGAISKLYNEGMSPAPAPEKKKSWIRRLTSR